jgi:hypothetical protein
MINTSHEQKNQASLAWVKVNGGIRHVSEFAHLPPEKRPYATCPVCHRPVIMRLGEKRIFHAAHRPEDVCIVTQPETAKHINAKYLLYQQLSQTSIIRINRKCDGLHHVKDFPPEGDCLFNQTTITEYIKGWDRVMVEENIDQYRPDLLLLSGTQPVGAVEVFVTHSVEQQKAEYFSVEKLPWVEVLADDVIGEDGVGWTADKVLPVTQYNPSVFEMKWVCPECIEELNEFREEQKQKEKKEEDRKRRDQIQQEFQVNAFRVVDFYYSERKTYRAVYYVRERKINDQIVEILLDDGKEILKRVVNPKIPDDRKILNNAFQNHIKSFRNKGHIVDDNQMHWQPQQNVVSEIVLRDEELFQKRYVWTKYEKWYAISFYKDICWDEYWKDRSKYIELIRERQRMWRQGKRIPNKTKPAATFSQTRRPAIGLNIETADSDVSTEVEAPIQTERPQIRQKETGVCVYCHQMTNDWWYINKETKQCKCHECFDKGLA